MPNNIPKPEDILGKTNTIPTPDEVLGSSKKKEQSASKSDGEVGQRFSDITKAVDKKSSELSTSGKPNGVYTYDGRKGAIYKKVDGVWHIDPNNSGKFAPIPSANKDRIKLLEAQAKQIFNSGVDETEFEFQKANTFAKGKQTEEQAAQQEAFKKDFAAKDVNDPDVIAKNNYDSYIEKQLDNINSDVVSQDEEDAIPRIKSVIQTLGMDPNTFELTEEGAGYDAVRIKNKKTGEDVFINLSNWTSDRDNEEAKLLKGFLDVQSKFHDLTRLKEQKSVLESKLSDLNAADAVAVKDQISKINKDIENQEALRNNYVAGDKYKSAAVYSKTAVNNIKTEYQKTALQSIDLKKKNDDLDKWRSEVDAALADGRISQEQYELEYKPKIDAEQKAIFDEAVSIKDNMTSLASKGSTIDEIAGANYAFQENRGNILTGATRSFVEGGENVLRFALEGSSGLSPEEAGKIADQIAPESVSKEYLSSDERNAFEKVVFGLTNSLGSATVGALLVPGYGSTFGLYASSYMNMKDQVNTAEMADVPEYEKILLSGLYGASVGLLEKYGLSKAFSKSPVGSKVVNYILGKTFSTLPKNASAEVIEQEINKNISTLVSKGLINATGAGLIEGSTELGQEIADIGIKEVYDLAKGKDYFEGPKTGSELMSRLGESFALGMLGGASMGALSQSVNIPKTGMEMKDLARIEESIVNPNIKDIFEISLKNRVISGEITADQARSEISKLNAAQNTLKQIPETLTPEQKLESFKLISEREELNQAISKYDEALTTPERARVAEINEQLKTIAQNAVQKQTAGEVSVQPETTTGQKVEGGKPEAEPQVVTEEGKEEVEDLTSDPATYSQSLGEAITAMKEEGKGLDLQVSPVSVEDASAIVKDGGKIFMTKDRSAGGYVKRDGYMGGLFKNPKSPLKKIAKAVQQARVKAGGFFMDAYATELEPMYIKNGFRPVARLKFNEEYAPEGWDAENSPLKNKPDVVFFAYDPDGKYNVGDGEYVESYDQAYEMAKNIGSDLKATREAAVLSEAFGPTNVPLSKQVKRAQKAIAKILPDVQIVVHNTEDEYRKATGETDSKQQASRGEYNPTTNTIHINKAKANGRTVAHEVFHAVIIKKVGTDAAATQLTGKMIRAVDKAVKKTGNTELASYLNDFISNYEKNVQSEEKMAELVGYLAENFETLPLPTRNIIKQWIDSLLKRFGIKPMTDNEIVELMNTIAGKVAVGEEIDMNSITGVTTEIQTSSKKRKQVKVDDKYKLSFVTKEDIIDIDSLINDIADKKQKVWFWVADQLGRGHYYDTVLDGEHFLDAGPSFALDPTNRDNNVIWASGANKKTLQKNIDNSDYIFIISGSPEKSKLFNKTVTNLIRRRIESAVDFDTFKKELLESKPTSKIKNVIEKYNSYDELFLGPDRKEFVIAINEQQSKGTKAKQLLEKYNAFVDPNSLRDGFYESNGFDMGDIMLVLKADGLGGKSNHSTYETDILGSVVGVPDKKINAYDIMPSEIKDAYAADLSRTQQLQVVAPYGIGIKEVSKRKQLSPEIQSALTTDGKGNYVFHHYSEKRRDTIKPGSGTNIITGKDEGSALSAVGGLTQYYTMKGQAETGVGNELHTVLVPMDRVYDFYKDPDNLLDEAQKRFEKARPGQAFNPNYQLAFITQVANENGYDMVVAPWRNNEYRAQTTLELTPEAANTQMKDRAVETYNVGDSVEVFGMNATITDVNGPVLTYKGEGVEGQINVDRNPRSIKKSVTTRKQIENDAQTLENRKQKKDDTLYKIVQKGRELGLSDAGIRKYAIDNGHTDKQISDAIVEYNMTEEGIFVKGEGKAIVDSIKSFKRRMLSARSFLPKSVFKLKEQKDANIAYHLNMVDRNVKDFNRLYKAYKGDKDVLLKNFDAYLRGDKNVELDEDFKIIANSMRNQVDGLSRQIIASGMVDEDQIKAIDKNLGSYLTRSYAVYERDNWKKEVSDEAIQSAKNYLREQYRPWATEMAQKEGMDVEQLLDERVDKEIDLILTNDEKSMFAKGGKEGSKNLSVLKERMDIPVEIRMLMGEYTDPGLNYAQTILKLSALAENDRYLTDIRKIGLGKFFYEKNDPRRPKEFNTEIASKDSKTMSPLNGLYTTKEIADAFSKQPQQVSEVLKYFMKIQSVIKWNKTIGSVATHFKNVFGNVGFILMNGHLSGDALSSAFKTTANDLFNMTNKELRAKMDHYIKLGIVKQSAGLGEIRDMFKDANFDNAMAARLKQKDLTLYEKAKRGLLRTKKGFEDWYQAEDDFFKIVAYENEVARYSEAMFGKKYKELTDQQKKEVDDNVSEIVKNVYPTYDRIPEAVQRLRRFPFMGNFISFQAESYRTMWNTFALAKEELASDNPKIKSIGAARMVGATTYIAIKSSVIGYLSKAAGTGFTGLMGYLLDDEEEDKKDKDIRKFIAPWSKQSDLMILSTGDGKINYIDFSASDPHGGLKKAMNSFFLSDNPVDGLIDFTYGLAEPFLGEEMATEALLNLRNNQNKNGGQIYNPEESLLDKSQKIAGYLYTIFEFGTVSTVRRLVDKEGDKAELAGIIGYKPYEVDVNEQFGYTVRDLSDRIKNAKRIYNSTYYNEESTDEQKQKDLKRAQVALDGIYKDMIDNYNSAERLGVNPDDLKVTMADFGNMSKRDIRSIQAGEIPQLKEKTE